MNLFKKIETMFNNYDMTIRSYLSKTFANLGLQYTHSQIFGVIFDGVKGVMQNALFYIEDALNEQNIFKATRKQSIYSLAKLSGYEAFYGSAAVGILFGKMQVNNALDSQSTKIYIKNHTRIVNKATNINYILSLPTDFYVCDISRSLTTHEFKIVQGIMRRTSYTAKGFNLETMNVESKDFFDKEYITVTVNGKDWNRVENIYDMTEDSEDYVFSTSFNNGFTIMFGNGIHGKKLKEGDNVTIQYLSHNGTNGNIVSNTQTNFIFDERGSDGFGNLVDINDYIKLSMANCVSGGTNSDTIEFVRNMVGKNSRSLVFASKDNFELFFKRFSFIGQVNCWSEPNSMYVIASCTKNIKPQLNNPEDYYNLTKNDILLSEVEKEMITNTLENSKRTFAGVTLKFEDPILRKFAIICYVKVNDVFEREIVKANIKKYIALYFINNKDTQFIAKSDIIKYLLDNISQIKSLDITILSGMYEETYKDKYYYEYEFKEINGKYLFVKTKKMYEIGVYPGLDNIGNISLKSKIEIPVLLNNFKYVINKNDTKLNNTSNTINLDAVQVYFD